jgi:hypothetical protein
MRESKECAECGGIYFRAEGVTQAQWEARRYCSVGCAGKGLVKRNAAKKAEATELVTEVPKIDLSVTQIALLEPKTPVVRDLRIVRVGPNPRTVTCEYQELAQRRTCTVFVRRNDKFVRGMRLQMAEPVSDAEFGRPWVYTGPPPRRRGKW